MKFSKLIVALAVSTAALASCQKPGPDPVPPVDYDKFKFTSTCPERDNKTEWNESEQIAVLWQKADKSEGRSTASASAAGKKAEFIASVDSTNMYYAVYPATATVSLTDSAAFAVTVPASQGGYLSRTGVMVAATDAKSAEFAFSSVVPVLKFTVDRDDVTGVSLRGYNGEPLAGSFAVLMRDGNLVYGQPSSTSDEIEVSVDGVGVYYVAVLPGLDLKDGLMLRYSKSGEYLPAMLVKDAAGFEVSQVSNLGTVTAVTEITVDSPAAVETFREMLYVHSTKSEDGTYVYDEQEVIRKCWLANGVTFKFPKGTYDLLGADAEDGDCIDMEYWHYGDRYKSPVKVKVEGAGVGETIFTGNADEAGTKGHGMFKVQDYAQLSLKDVTMRDCYKPGGTKGGPVMIASKTQCVVNAENCSFEHNVLPDGGGAAIGQADGGVLYAKNCRFADNKAKNGGAIYGTQAVDMTFEDCVFENNVGTGSNGPSVAIFWNNAYAKFNDCLFKGNRAADRAVLNTQQTSVVLLNGCTFENNSNTQESKYASAIHAGGEFVGINNCTFWQNNAKNASNQPQNNSECISANGNMIIANSTFYEYFQANRGVIAGLAAGKTAYIFNDIILNSYSGTAIYFSSAGYSITSYGHNVMRNITDYRSGKPGINVGTGDVTGAAANVLDGAAYDPEKYVYKWSGSLTTGTLVPATATEFETCVKSYTTELANTSLAGKKAGEAFWNWLVSVDATTTDQLGTNRGSSWWPGSYQFN